MHSREYWIRISRCSVCHTNDDCLHYVYIKRFLYFYPYSSLHKSIIYPCIMFNSTITLLLTPSSYLTFIIYSIFYFHDNICRPDDLEKRPHADRFNASINNLYKNQKFQYVEVRYSIVLSAWLRACYFIIQMIIINIVFT